MSSPRPTPLPRRLSLAAARANLHKAEEELFEPIMKNLEEIDQRVCRDGGEVQAKMKATINDFKDLRVILRSVLVVTGELEDIVEESGRRSMLLRSEVDRMAAELRSNDVRIGILTAASKMPLEERPGPSHSGPSGSEPPTVEKEGGTGKSKDTPKGKKNKAKKNKK